ncbi:MAG: argininosuccinate lyase [Spirochaetaceae bacterium]|nr:MAG: argininosuccinate lyase [Spirochaetaceae bacterium]
MAKIWDKGYSLDALVERFTVGDDYLLDRRLVASDAVASIAHAEMLAAVGLLADAERDDLVRELRAIACAATDTGVEVRRDQEDSHTAIEELLTDRLGDTGKRIHTGRSRNDQVAASTRLFAREGTLAVAAALADTVAALGDLARAHAATPMAGRTHMQPAMPSTVGLWAASYAEALCDEFAALRVHYGLLNRSPLGAAAGYGVPLDLDRELVARLAGFDSVHHNVIAAVTSRGHIEYGLLGVFDRVGLVLGRLATDLILFSLPEFGWFRLPDELCSGSSIMPQKKNPDGLELMRAKASVLSSYADRVRDIVRNLPSGYNRDVQETKAPLVAATDLMVQMLRVMTLSVSSLSVNESRLRELVTEEVLATDRAIEHVERGTPFRDAYRIAAAELATIDPHAPVDSDRIDAAIARRTSTGAPGNPGIDRVFAAVGEMRCWIDERQQSIDAAVSSLVGRRLPLYPGSPAED